MGEKSPLEAYPSSISEDVIRLVYEAGIWANLQCLPTGGSKAQQKKLQIDALHTEITKKAVLSPGACTQLRDMALACGLIMVAQMHFNGGGIEDAERWLKRSLEP